MSAHGRPTLRYGLTALLLLLIPYWTAGSAAGQVDNTAHARFIETGPWAGLYLVDATLLVEFLVLNDEAEAAAVAIQALREQRELDAEAIRLLQAALATSESRSTVLEAAVDVEIEARRAAERSLSIERLRRALAEAALVAVAIFALSR